MLLYFGVAWNAEQTISHPRQPLHLSASILIVLIFFLILAIFQYPSLFQVFCNIIQIQFMQPFFSRNTVIIPPLEFVIGGQELFFKLGKSLLPMVCRRLLSARVPRGY
jgi:hypothetical protein